MQAAPSVGAQESDCTRGLRPGMPLASRRYGVKEGMHVLDACAKALRPDRTSSIPTWRSLATEVPSVFPEATHLG